MHYGSIDTEMGAAILPPANKPITLWRPAAAMSHGSRGDLLVLPMALCISDIKTAICIRLVRHIIRSKKRVRASRSQENRRSH